jgi:fatty-acyl-CoA synthase
MSAETKKSAGWTLKLAAAALGVAIFTVLWFAAAALGAKFGLWGWQFGLGKMTLAWGIPLAFFAMGLSVVALILGFIKAPRTKPVMLAIGALLISTMVGFRVIVGFGGQAASLPPIHDVQTDWSEPIAFSESLIAQRRSDGALNPVEDDPTIDEGADSRWPGMGGRRVAEVQEEAENERTIDGETVPPAYDRPIEPLYFDQAPGEIATYALELAEARGWEIFSRPETGQDVERTMIEATETSTWYGFKDDIAIRIRAVEGATRVDMRSISRVGLSDLGMNARRVTSYMDELEARAEGRRQP